MIDKLDFVLALARERHFGRAAESCGVTQPTLSAGLKSLEDALGILIVQRSSRFQGFTPEGERVLDWARRIVGDAKAMRQEIDTLKRGLGGQVRIAVIPTALPMVARLTMPFRAAHPGVRFTVLSRTSGEILTLLDNLEIDAGLTYLDNEPVGQVRTVPLYEERYRLLTSRDGEFAERSSVTWAEVGRLALCLLTPDMQNRRIIDQMLRRSGVPTRCWCRTRRSCSCRMCAPANGPPSCRRSSPTASGFPAASRRSRSSIRTCPIRSGSSCRTVSRRRRS